MRDVPEVSGSHLPHAHVQQLHQHEPVEHPAPGFVPGRLRPTDRADVAVHHPVRAGREPRAEGVSFTLQATPHHARSHQHLLPAARHAELFLHRLLDGSRRRTNNRQFPVHGLPFRRSDTQTRPGHFLSVVGHRP